MHLASNHKVFQKRKSRLTYVSEKFLGQIKRLNHLSNPSSEHEHDSDYSSSSRSGTHSDKSYNQKNIVHKKKSLSGDLVHQNNAALFSDVVEHNVERRKMLSSLLSELNFQTKIIQFTYSFMYNYDIKMLRERVK